MFVNKYSMRNAHLDGATDSEGTTGLTFNIGISQTPWLVDQDDIIRTKFVDVEVENAINPIFDYENVRFNPRITGATESHEVDFITYKLNMLDTNGSYPADTFWSTIGFVSTDFTFRKNSFVKSFLRLDFFDSDIGTKQRLLFFKTLFPDTFELGDPSNRNLKFTLGNTLKDRKLNGEGFFIYYYKEDVIPTIPKELYMRATFFNAKDGKTTTFMASADPDIEIDALAKKGSGELCTRYLLKREVEGYFYEIDENYSSNVTTVIGNATGPTSYQINLNQISVL